jgi:hypothetical protein
MVPRTDQDCAKNARPRDEAAVAYIDHTPGLIPKVFEIHQYESQAGDQQCHQQQSEQLSFRIAPAAPSNPPTRQYRQNQAHQ